MDTGVSTGLGHGLAGAVAVAPVANDPAAQPGEFRWGGIAGTQWWISPRRGLAVLMMAQRHMAFWHPFSLEFKRLAYQAMGP
jgi:CubicO group peptidase (beta-lactamase class C family)